MTLDELRKANAARELTWNRGRIASPEFRAMELGGEVGEVMNVVKKLVRESAGLAGSRASIQDLADELGDVLICLDLMAIQYNIDLAEATKRKFNATSAKYGFSEVLK